MKENKKLTQIIFLAQNGSFDDVWSILADKWSTFGTSISSEYSGFDFWFVVFLSEKDLVCEGQNLITEKVCTSLTI